MKWERLLLHTYSLSYLAIIIVYSVHAARFTTMIQRYTPLEELRRHSALCAFHSIHLDVTRIDESGGIISTHGWLKLLPADGSWMYTSVWNA